MRYVVFLLTLLLSAAAYAQIEVAPETPVYTPIPVSVISTVPDGAKVDGPGWVWPEGVNKIEIGPNKFIVCAPPGEYTIEYHLEWLHIVPVTFIDGSGKEITIQSYLGSGKTNYTAKFKVVGGTPPVPPPPPPPPPGERRAVILMESEQRTPAEALLYQQLALELKPPKLQILDDDQPSAQKFLPLLPTSMSTVRPVMLVMVGETAFRAVPLPSSVAAVKELMNQ